MKNHGNKQSKIQTNNIMKKFFVFGLSILPVLALAVPTAPEPVPEGATVISFQYDAMGNRISQSNSNPDSDGDGILDSWELEHFGDLTHDMSLDTDNDGLTDLDEYNALTNPILADTDDDGINDGFELNNGMDPLDAADALVDTDNDGLPDAFEIFHGLNINDASDATIDNDNDGYSVLQEFRGSTSDNDANEYPAFLIDFESTPAMPFYWDNKSEAPWKVVPLNESTVLHVGESIVGESTLILTFTASGQPLQFDLLSEPQQLEDEVQFYIDGVLQSRTPTNFQGFEQFTYMLSAGKHQLKWIYNIADSGTPYFERAVLDNILLPIVKDSDNDGIDDTWEYLYFYTLDNDMSLDSDVDGLTDLEEYQAGTDPLVTDNIKPIDEFPIGLITNGDFETDNDFNPRNANVPLSFETNSPIKGLRSLKGSANGYDYITYTHTDFSTSGANLTNVNLSGFIQASRRMRVTVRVSYIGGTWSDSSSGYRLTPKTGEQIELLLDVPLDSLREVSNIKLTIASEGTTATPTDFVIDNIQLQVTSVNNEPDPNDTDNDGILDSWEIEHFGGLNHDMSLDSDNDGLTDGEEFSAGTKPSLVDSDNDGMADGWEVTSGLNPLVNDASGDIDNDGTSNFVEYVLATSSYPVDSDTDEDGFTDVFEANNGLNPLDGTDVFVDTDNDGLPDAFEVFHNLNINDASDVLVDVDGDGFTVWQELHARTNDNDSASKPIGTYLGFEDNAHQQFYWTPQENNAWYIDNEHKSQGEFGLQAGVFIIPEDALDGTGISTMEVIINATGEPISFELLDTEKQAWSILTLYVDDVMLDFWQFGEESFKRVEFPMSAGKHRIKWEYKTIKLSTSAGFNVWLDNLYIPAIADSDSDAIKDGWEYLYFDTLEHDMSLDSDGDGLTDLEEYQAAKNPLIVDELPVDEFPDGLITNGDFETGNDFNPRNANVPLSFETNSPIKGLRSLKGSANGYDYITYTHTDFSTSGANLTNVNLSGFIQASRRMRVTVRVSYIGGTWSDSSSGYRLTPKTGEQIELLLDVPLDSLREVSNIKLTIASEGTTATPTDFVIDNIQLQVE